MVESMEHRDLSRHKRKAHVLIDKHDSFLEVQVHKTQRGSIGTWQVFQQPIHSHVRLYELIYIIL